MVFDVAGRATATEPEQPVSAGPALRGQIEVKQEPFAKAVKLEPTAPPQPQKPAFTNEVLHLDCNHETVQKTRNTGQLRYLEFQGIGENTSSFPKFEIANYDVT